MVSTQGKREVAELLKKFSSQVSIIASRPLIVIEEIRSWTNNQLFLTQKICQLILESKVSISDGHEKRIVKQIVRSRLIENWENQVAAEHLTQIRDSILGNKECVSLLCLYQRVLQEGGVAVNGNPISKVLLGSGLVSNKQGQLVVANRIYEAVFDGNWVERELANMMKLLNSGVKPGQIIDRRYEIIKELGSSKFGLTYLAKDKSRQTQPQCVVKQLTEGQDRFRQKVEILENISHNQIPRLLASFEVNQQFYVVQDFINGRDLSEELTADKKWNKHKVINLLLDILEIVDFCHKEEIIHGNIKPSNLRIRQRDGKIVLIDFGVVEEETYSKDIRAVGMIGIQALTGLDPSGLPRDVNGNIIWRRWLQEKGSTKLADILDKMVSPDGNQQYASVVEVLNDLGKLAPQRLKMKPILVRRTIPVLVIAGILFFITGGILFYEHISRSFSGNKSQEKAQTLINQKQYNDALKELEKMLKEKPDDFIALALQGYVFGQLNPPKTLKQYSVCDQAIKIKPDFAGAFNCRGNAQYALHKYLEAVNDYDMVIQLESKPEFIRPWYNEGKELNKAKFNKAEALLPLKENKKAKEILDDLLQIDPNYPKAKELRDKIPN